MDNITFTLDDIEPEETLQWIITLSTKSNFSILWALPIKPVQYKKHSWRSRPWLWCAGDGCLTCLRHTSEVHYHVMVFDEASKQIVVAQFSKALWKSILKKMKALPKLSIGPTATIRIIKMDKALTVEATNWGEMAYDEIVKTTEPIKDRLVQSREGKRLSKKVGDSNG